MTNLSNIITDNNVLTDNNTQTVTNKTISGASNTITNLTNLDASQLSSGTVPTARLASGTADSTTYLRGDQTWDTISAGGLTYFADAESTTSPNDTVYVDSLTVQGSSTNVDIALAAKGNGATLAEIPDGTTTGGAKRGIYATDWQKYRLNTSEVASGAYSTIVGGSRNTSSGNYSVSGGIANTASGATAIALGDSNSPNGSTSVALGYNNSTAGQFALSLGSGNTSNGFASVALGYQNTLSNSNSFAMGRSITSDGFASAAFGYETDVKGRWTAIVLGTNSTASTNSNAAQAAIQILSTDTSDATPTLLNSSSSGSAAFYQARIDPNSAYAFRVLVVANVTGGGDTKAWELVGCIKQGATPSTTALVGSVTKTVIAADTGASSWDCDIDVDTTYGAFTVEATGAAATSIRWGATVYTTEVDY